MHFVNQFVGVVQPNEIFLTFGSLVPPAILGDTDDERRLQAENLQFVAHALPLIDTAKARGFAVETCAMDKGYDARHIYEGCEDRDVGPIIPLINTVGVKRGDHKTPTCEHGAWRFAGADYSRKATKWRCSTGECAPASVWIKAELACTLARAGVVPLAA